MIFVSPVYSTYEAKARFSELLRRVREGKSVGITYRGRMVAEMRPVYETNREEQLRDLEGEGLLSPPAAPTGKLRPIVKKKGALDRFLESRE